MKITKDSHIDHSLTQAQLDHITTRFAGRTAFFIETFELPSSAGTVPCGLYGPSMGDSPVDDAGDLEVHWDFRGDRKWKSRLIAAPTRPTQLVTVIAGPHDAEPCVMYTAFGGPCAPQEPGDPGCRDFAASVDYWLDHALARNV